MCTVCVCVMTVSQLVDGVITEDSDVFLYGALVVYKQLSTGERVRAGVPIATWSNNPSCLSSSCRMAEWSGTP